MNELEQSIPTEKEIRDLLPGYVMGNLDEEELWAVRTHLSTYPDLQEELRSLESTVMQLAYSAPAANPPVGSRTRILARARIDAEQAQANDTAPVSAISAREGRTPAPVSSPNTSSTTVVRYGPVQPKATQPPSRSLWGHFSDWWGNAIGWKMYALATSVALALLAGIFNQTQNELQLSIDRVAELQSQNESLALEQETLAEERTALADALAEQEVYFSQLKAEDDALIGSLKSTLQTVDTANTELQESVTQLETSNAALAAANQELTTANQALTTTNAELTTTNTGLESTNTQLSQANMQLIEENATLQTQAVELQQTVRSLQQQVDAQDRFWAIFPTIRRVVTLEATIAQSTASGTLWSSIDGNFLLLDGLAELPSEQTYQLWLITADEEAIDSGLLTVSPNEPGPISVELPLEIGDFAAVGISIEPAGGSATPTDVVLLGLRS